MRRWVIVVLPAPEGEDSTSRKPRRGIPEGASGWRAVRLISPASKVGALSSAASWTGIFLNHHGDTEDTERMKRAAASVPSVAPWFCCALRARRRRGYPARGRARGVGTRRLGRLPSFEVLHLLAELLDRRLQGKADAGQLDIGRFRAQRVGLAVQFLAQEIELPADRLAALEQVADLREMGAQPVELLADIGAADQHRQFLGDPLLRHRRRETGQFGEQGLEPGA